MITIYVDGACSGNGKENSKGGFGVVIVDKDNDIVLKKYQEFSKNTTNNREELKAIIYAMKNYGSKEWSKDIPEVYSDSIYSVNTLNDWMFNWAKNNWIKSDKKTPENLDLIQEYYNLYQSGLRINLKHIKGHNGNKYNELADDLATGKIKIEIENDVSNDYYITNLGKIQPEDTLVLHIKLGNIDIQDARDIFEDVKKEFPENHIVAVLDGIELTKEK